MVLLGRNDCFLFFTGMPVRGLAAEIWLPHLAKKKAWPLADCDLKKTITGQPQLKVNGRLLRCSISHAIGLTVVALHPELAIGVDAELIDATRSDVELLATYFPCVKPSPKDEEGNDLFLTHWTMAEAYLKAQGIGFSQSDMSLTNNPSANTISWIEEYDNNRWRISQICLGPHD
jgi:phosphopantetheinyl transferase